MESFLAKSIMLQIPKGYYQIMFSKPIVGFRFWKITGEDQDPVLKSVGLGDTVWEEVSKATCRIGYGHKAPDPDCSCGLYAYHKANISQRLSSLRFLNHTLVYGAVLGKGAVQISVSGWRSEEAQVFAFLRYPGTMEAVYEKTDYQKILKLLSKKYNAILVDSIEELETIAYSFGTSYLSLPNRKLFYPKNTDEPYVNEKGHQYWIKNDTFHRDDGPAIITDNSKIWMRNGLTHRDDDFPAVITDAKKQWFKYGRLHREKGPAEIFFLKNNIITSECWYQNGFRHRIDGPAIIRRDGHGEQKQWCIDGTVIKRSNNSECSGPFYIPDHPQFWQHEGSVQ